MSMQSKRWNQCFRLKEEQRIRHARLYKVQVSKYEPINSLVLDEDVSIWLNGLVEFDSLMLFGYI